MQPFRSILFAADFSLNSKEAFRAACSLVVENKTRLVVLHVAAPEWVPDGPVYQAQQAVQFHPGEPDQARLDALKAKLRETYVPRQAIDVDYQTVEGDAPNEILRMAQEIGSDLIAMGTHGIMGVRRLLAGSVAIAVLRGAHRPVLALRSGAKPRETGEIRVIIHPTDFSADSELALQVARSLARDHGARLILLYVAPFPVGAHAAMTAALDVIDDSDGLEAARDVADGPDLKYPVETWFARGEAPDEIVRVANEVGCDLIVMGTHGRTGLGRLLLGNTAESVLPEASCPVIILKSPKQATPTISSSPPDKKVVTVF
jgi:nucleotide-binding universal stress UspA family protein